MDHRDWDISVIPVANIGRGLDLTDIEARFDALKVMLKPVSHQHRFSVRTFNQILQRIKLSVMNVDMVAVITVNCTICHLQELA